MWAVVSIFDGPGANLGVHLSGVRGMGCNCTATSARPGVQLWEVWAVSARRPGGDLAGQLSRVCALYLYGNLGANWGSSCRGDGLYLHGDLGATWGSICRGLYLLSLSGFLFLLFLSVFVSEEREEDGNRGEEKG